MLRAANVSDWRAVLSGAFAQNRLRSAIAVLAIALGVALGFAVQLINGSAVNALAQSVRTVSGDADLVVRGSRSGFDESLFVQLARDPEVAVASPAVEVEARVAGADEYAARGRPRPLPRRRDPAGARRRSRQRPRHAAAGYDLPLHRRARRVWSRARRHHRLAGRTGRRTPARRRPAGRGRQRAHRGDGHRRRAGAVRQAWTTHAHRLAAARRASTRGASPSVMRPRCRRGSRSTGPTRACARPRACRAPIA